MLDHIQQGWVDPNDGNGLIGTSIAINYDTCENYNTPGVSTCNENCNWNVEFGFKSMHPGGGFPLRRRRVTFSTSTLV